MVHKRIFSCNISRMNRKKVCGVYFFFFFHYFIRVFRNILLFLVCLFVCLFVGWFCFSSLLKFCQAIKILDTDKWEHIFQKNFFCHTHILPARKNLGVVNGSNQITKQTAVQTARKRKVPHAGKYKERERESVIEIWESENAEKEKAREKGRVQRSWGCAKRWGDWREIHKILLCRFFFPQLYNFLFDFSSCKIKWNDFRRYF